MTIFMFFKLLIGLSNKPFKLSSDYNHLKFLLTNKYIENVYMLSESSHRLASPNGKFTLTARGKSAMFIFINQTITWGISLTAIIISIIALCK